MRRARAVVWVVLVAGALMLLLSGLASRLEAQTLFEFRRQVYAAKFMCGELKPGEVQEEGPVKPGNYQTAINVHNPSRLSVTFLKKAVLLFDSRRAVREFEQPRPPGQRFRASLFPDWGLEIDCPDIRLVLLGGIASPPPAFIKGWVVIETFTLGQPLDVVAAYTAHGFTIKDPSLPPVPEGFSIQVLPVTATVPAF